VSALVQLNGLPVSRARISLPRVGVWRAEVALAQAEAFGEGRGTLQFGPSLSLTGTVRRSGSADGAGLLMLVGGSGNLYRTARPRAYRQAPCRIPLSDLLAEAEETLSPFAHREVLDAALPAWVTPSLPICQCLAVLLGRASASWRVLPDGTFWVGNEAWPEAPDFNHILLTEVPLADAFELFTQEPALLPGQTFRERRVSYVEHHVTGDDVRTVAYLEAA